MKVPANMDWLVDIYNFRVVAQFAPDLVRGLVATIWISALALSIALVVGTLTAFARLETRAGDRIGATYVQVIRSTPLLVQIYLIYFALPELPLLGRRLDEFECGMLALGLNAGAYMSEIIRSGIEAVPRGQVEGAKSVGMSYVQRMRYVVLPQAISKVVPPLLGQTAILVKDSSLVSFIGVFELFSAGLAILSERLMPNEAFMTLAACYLFIYAILLFLATQAQRRLGGAQ
ncbi:amino acid ABC transporter permease [Roseovarius sp. CAU 1744]|uniref:amino acid ABC transporter permease n=1 Tax=Roseovarius sp. CAU 1744 TaxID=3140368 RepID=UPI00325BE0ED